MTRRAYYKKTIYYGESFVKDMELFEKLISQDAEIAKLKLQNDRQKFSAVLRYIIQKYNKQGGLHPIQITKS